MQLKGFPPRRFHRRGKSACGCRAYNMEYGK
jgi:hypothetical protein